MSTGTEPDAPPSRVGVRAFAWGILLVAALLEIVWALALKEAGGLARPGWAAFGIGVAMVSLGMLSYALRELPVGTAYAVWVGIGAVGVAAMGMVFLGEPVDLLRLVFLALILGGVVGLSLSESPAGSESEAREDEQPAPKG